MFYECKPSTWRIKGRSPYLHGCHTNASRGRIAADLRPVLTGISPRGMVNEPAFNRLIHGQRAASQTGRVGKPNSPMRHEKTRATRRTAARGLRGALRAP